MNTLINKFQVFLKEERKSDLTIKNYTSHMNHFLKWFEDSKGISFSRLKRENFLEYLSFLRNVEKVSRGKNKGLPLNVRTINSKISSLIRFNEFLINEGVEKEWLITKEDLIKIQSSYFSLSKIIAKDVERFRQLILEGFNSKRNFTIVTIMAYGGLRISEVLNLKIHDVSIVGGDIIVRKGKREKYRTVFMNDRVATALKGWFKERKEKGIDNEYLFVSKRNNKLDKTVINRMFNEYSIKLEIEITPHDLRHFFCTYLLEKGFAIHEVKNMAGHENINTTMIYANPSVTQMKEKMKNL
ncbi:tyrosine-type recombinase/integrase [Virgibacillus sp. DJP39]|uniref:tyrosine-type recombinase/integrase n=1 Tax=Virgibacillus sp. DJP39 TaxID=3409790 RepID=UPI003BB74689